MRLTFVECTESNIEMNDEAMPGHYHWVANCSNFLLLSELRKMKMHLNASALVALPPVFAIYKCYRSCDFAHSSISRWTSNFFSFFISPSGNFQNHSASE